MSDIVSSYRPHDPGHDYYAPGIYLITLVVRDRKSVPTLLGHLNDDVKSPGVCLSEVGKAVEEEWAKTPSIQQRKGNRITLINQVCMPDHWHGVVQVHERMNKSLGHIVQYVKSSCTARWREITGSVLDSSSSQMIRGMSERQREQYYQTLPYTYRPLWDDNYDDTICLSDPVTGEYCERHFRAMVRYVEDNPRRAIIRRARPQFMQRCLHVRIGDRDYAAFGNLFLLRWARKVQVFCHRKARYSQLSAEEKQRHGYTYAAAPELQTSIPYEETAAYKKECEHWEALVMAGATAIVTPGISRGERQMKDKCLDKGWPMIHLQKEPIGAYWKPEEKRFNACANGALLILAPWKAESLGEYNGVPSYADYYVFHNLNGLAEEICLFDGDAKVLAR